jgi:hypothetical protein
MPNDDGGVAAKLAGAKKALQAADTSNVSTRSGQPFGPSYTQARAARKEPKSDTGILQEASSTGAGIKSRMEMEDAARKSIQ